MGWGDSNSRESMLHDLLSTDLQISPTAFIVLYWLPWAAIVDLTFSQCTANMEKGLGTHLSLPLAPCNLAMRNGKEVVKCLIHQKSLKGMGQTEKTQTSLSPFPTVNILLASALHNFGIVFIFHLSLFLQSCLSLLVLCSSAAYFMLLKGWLVSLLLVSAIPIYTQVWKQHKKLYGMKI